MFQTMIEECTLRNYSPKTIKTYLFYNENLSTFVTKNHKKLLIKILEVIWYI